MCEAEPTGSAIASDCQNAKLSDSAKILERASGGRTESEVGAAPKEDMIRVMKIAASGAATTSVPVEALA